MAAGGRRSLFSFSYVFASFFGAAMIAAAFAYFNYKYSQYKFINFKEMILYTKSQLFVPATAGTNTLLKIIHRFHIREVPSYFMIKKQNDEGLYKQDSRIYLLDSASNGM